MIKSLLPLFLFLGLGCFAQDEIILRGQINNDISDKDFISVINLTMHRGTITDETGFFQIPAEVNDIIDVSGLQFKNVKFIVTEEIIKRGVISIDLELETMILPEITISTSSLSGNLSNDASAVEVDPTMNSSFLGQTKRIPTPAERRLYTATTRGENLVNDRRDLRFDIPLNAVLNAVSGRTKKIKTLIDKELVLKQVVALENKFAPDFFTDALEIDIAKIEDFLFYAQVVNETILNYQKYNDLVLVEALVKEATAYKLLNEVPDVEEE